MFKTFVGPVEDDASVAYLRPETAQGMFVNFANVHDDDAAASPRSASPRSGASFRNEITPGNFVFRTREFEQMEMEFFVPPADSPRWFEYWCNERLDWYRRYGIPTSRGSGSATTTPRSSPTTPPARRTSSSCSRGAGASSRASRTAPTST